MTNYQPHQQRVVDEKRELDERLNKLRAFISTVTFSSLSLQERELLEAQKYSMTLYSESLGKRIILFANKGTKQ